MADLNSKIDNIVAGDDCDIIREITNVPIGTSLTDAWFTIKEDYWDLSEIVVKHVTLALSDSGMIEDAGDDKVGVVRFRLSKEETELLYPHFEYDFDIKVKTEDGSYYTPESGKLIAYHSVTVPEE